MVPGHWFGDPYRSFCLALHCLLQIDLPQTPISFYVTLELISEHNVKEDTWGIAEEIVWAEIIGMLAPVTIEGTCWL